MEQQQYPYPPPPAGNYGTAPPPPAGNYGTAPPPPGVVGQPGYPNAPPPDGYGYGNQTPLPVYGAPAYQGDNPNAYPQQMGAPPDTVGKIGQQPVYGNQEIGGISPNYINPDMPASIRNGFIRKVYLILSTQLVITFGLAIAFTLVEPMKNWLLTNTWFLYTAMILSFVLLIAMACVPSLTMNVPINYIMLTLVTLCFTVLVSYAGAASESEAFFMAAGITLVVVIGLTIFALQTKIDFTGMGTYLFVFLMVLVLFGILTLFFRSRILQIVYASLGALLFSFYIVYDTQMIAGGQHRKYQYSVDMYIFGALTLYLDIINLFMFILSLLNNTS